MVNMKSFNMTLFTFPHKTHPVQGRYLAKEEWQVKDMNLDGEKKRISILFRIQNF